MSDRNAIWLTVMVLVLALLIFVVQKNLYGELRILNDRIETAKMNGHVANPVPIAGEE